MIGLLYHQGTRVLSVFLSSLVPSTDSVRLTPITRSPKIHPPRRECLFVTYAAKNISTLLAMSLFWMSCKGYSSRRSYLVGNGNSFVLSILSNIDFFSIIVVKHLAASFYSSSDSNRVPRYLMTSSSASCIGFFPIMDFIVVNPFSITTLY